MKTTLNSLNLKKGNTVFIFGNWNGNEGRNIDFYIQEYTIHSIGKKRCYLIYNDDTNSRREYSSTSEMNIAITFEEAIIKCKEYQLLYTENQLKECELKLSKFANNKQYVALTQRIFNNLNTAPQRILINPYTSENPKII